MNTKAKKDIYWWTILYEGAFARKVFFDTKKEAMAYKKSLSHSGYLKKDLEVVAINIYQMEN